MNNEAAIEEGKLEDEKAEYAPIYFEDFDQEIEDRSKQFSEEIDSSNRSPTPCVEVDSSNRSPTPCVEDNNPQQDQPVHALHGSSDDLTSPTGQKNHTRNCTTATDTGVSHLHWNCTEAKETGVGNVHWTKRNPGWKVCWKEAGVSKVKRFPLKNFTGPRTIPDEFEDQAKEKALDAALAFRSSLVQQDVIQERLAVHRPSRGMTWHPIRRSWMVWSPKTGSKKKVVAQFKALNKSPTEIGKARLRATAFREPRRLLQSGEWGVYWNRFTARWQVQLCEDNKVVRKTYGTQGRSPQEAERIRQEAVETARQLLEAMRQGKRQKRMKASHSSPKVLKRPSAALQQKDDCPSAAASSSEPHLQSSEAPITAVEHPLPGISSAPVPSGVSGPSDNLCAPPPATLPTYAPEEVLSDFDENLLAGLSEDEDW